MLMSEPERLRYRILSKHHSSLSCSRRMPANHLLSRALTRPWSRQRQAECRAVGPATCLSLSRLGCLSLGSIVLQQASQCQADTVDCGIQISPLMTTLTDTLSNYCGHFSHRDILKGASLDPDFCPRLKAQGTESRPHATPEKDSSVTHI